MEHLQLIRIGRVLEVTGLRRSSLYRKIAAGEFPLPVKIGERASAWVASEVSQWIEETIAASRSAK